MHELRLVNPSGHQAININYDWISLNLFVNTHNFTFSWVFGCAFDSFSCSDILVFIFSNIKSVTNFDHNMDHTIWYH